jgi:hypothetical protein
MANTIKLRRSATSGAVPTTGQLALGELAMNTFDGKLFIKTDQSGTESIAEIGAGGSTITIASTPPGSPDVGDIYWDDVDGSAYIYYDDGNTQQWVSLSAASSASAATSVILENERDISDNYTISANYNGLSAGPVSVAANKTVTVPANAIWAII